MAIITKNALLAKPRKSGPHYPSIVKTCSCTNPFLDAQYGAGKRVHNSRMANKELTYSCTSCGKGSRPPSPAKVGFKSPRKAA